jgi:hypothetical protein
VDKREAVISVGYTLPEPSRAPEGLARLRESTRLAVTAILGPEVRECRASAFLGEAAAWAFAFAIPLAVISHVVIDAKLERALRELEARVERQVREIAKEWGGTATVQVRATDGRTPEGPSGQG